MTLRHYHPDSDRDAVRRIWHEVGWLPKGKEEAMYLYIEAGRALVAEMDGAAECLVQTAPGTIRYLEEDLPFACVTGVTTSHVARKRNLPKRLIAAALAADVAEHGSLVAGLGMFEQGFYDQLGFGTGEYEHWVAFDPSHVRVDVRARTPRRIGPDDWQRVHAARLGRWMGHGGCNLTLAAITRADMLFAENGLGLGYCDGTDGALTHCLWCSTSSMEHGPYRVAWLLFRTGQQFLELMALIRTLGDQVRLITMREPRDIQLQDLLDRPFFHRAVSEKSRFESHMRAEAYWQTRICDLAGCLAKTHLRCETTRLNLVLTDPAEQSLEGTASWRGVGGTYVVSLGESSGAERGTDPSLPTLTASVSAFTRLWLGVRPATGLAVTDELFGPPELLEQLDRTFLVPEPKPDWDF